MWVPTLSAATRRLWHFLLDRVREVQARRARYWERYVSNCEPEARGLKLLREWLSPEQRAQFDIELAEERKSSQQQRERYQADLAQARVSAEQERTAHQNKLAEVEKLAEQWLEEQQQKHQQLKMMNIQSHACPQATRIS